MRVELKERERTGVRSYSLPASHGFEILEGAASGKQWRDVYWGWGTPKVVIQMLLFGEEPAHCCVHITHAPDAHSWSLFFFFLMLCSIPIDPSWIGSFFCSLFWVYFQSHWRGRPSFYTPANPQTSGIATLRAADTCNSWASAGCF